LSLSDTITAQATAPGRGGVGIIRISGKLCETIAASILGLVPKPRHAHHLPFYSTQKTVIDKGIALYFKAPHSFTGEDVLELQGHGGPVVLDMLLREVIAHGARLALPGEFSQRAYLNDKIDLAQAEAVADLINASSEQAARSAIRSLDGEFSQKIHQLVDALIHLRIYVEAGIDFPEEEIDFLSDGKIEKQLLEIIEKIDQLQQRAKQGSLLREGINIVIAGKPNVGKSSLLNRLAGRESAIVTDIEGTTRDVLKEQILIDGLPVHIIDTAGLRESQDVVEKIGIEKAWTEIKKADHLLLMTDAKHANLSAQQIWQQISQHPMPTIPVTILVNKIDLYQAEPAPPQKGVTLIKDNITSINLSVKEDIGINLLTEHLKQSIGFNQTAEGSFLARRRHLTALENAATALENAKIQLQVYKAGELVAEELKQAQESLSQITGEFSSDDLLGEIFSSFCIGK